MSAATSAGLQPQVLPEHYAGASYDTPERLHSYRNQVDAVACMQPGNVLEVGIGNGYVSAALRDLGLAVCTLDFDASLRPQVAGSALALPFGAGAFDVVLCCQVLEHLPFLDVPTALAELRRVSRVGAVISLPNVEPGMRVTLRLPRGRKRLVLRRWWRPRPAESTLPEQHYWELGMKGFPPRRLCETLEAAGFDVLRHYRLYDNPYHHFFELRVAS